MYNNTNIYQMWQKKKWHRRFFSFHRIMHSHRKKVCAKRKDFLLKKILRRFLLLLSKFMFRKSGSHLTLTELSVSSFQQRKNQYLPTNLTKGNINRF